METEVAAVEPKIEEEEESIQEFVTYESDLDDFDSQSFESLEL